MSIRYFGKQQKHHCILHNKKKKKITPNSVPSPTVQKDLEHPTSKDFGANDLIDVQTGGPDALNLQITLLHLNFKIILP